MKKLILFFVLVFTASSVGIAQDISKKELIKKGDLVQATYYYDNGEISQKGFYNISGKLQGTWISYDISGNKTAVALYDNGVKTGTWYFYDGDILREVKYKDNKIAEVTTWRDSETQVVGSFKK